MNLNLLPKAIERAYIDLLATEGSYEDFTNQIYKDIDEICTHMLTESELHRDQTETQLSHYVWSMLRMKWDTAQKDAYNNGNADISITHGPFVWIAEAKIWGGKDKYKNNYLYGGYLQLTERYSKGQIGATGGAMLIYVKPNNSNQTESIVMNNWQKYLAQKLGRKLISLTPCKLKSSCIYSVQPHSSTDYYYNVRHIPITFLHIPRDTSAKKAKKYKKITEDFDKDSDISYDE